MSEKESFDKVFRIAKFTLQFFGILPLNGTRNIWKERISNILIAATLCCITSVNISVLHYMMTANLDMEGRLDALNSVAGVLGGEFRMIFILLNRRKIQHLVATCEALWMDATLVDYKIISVWADRAKRLSLVLCTTTTLSVLVYVLQPMIKQMISGTDIHARSWPYQINMDPAKSPRYEIYYVAQVVYCIFGTCSIIGCDVIGPVLALHASGQLRLIQSWLLNTWKQEGKLDEQGNVNAIVKKCIRRHQIVLDFCAQLEEVVRYAQLALALGGMYMMAISATRLTKVQYTGLFKNLSPIFLSLGQLLLSCWPAEQLLSESNKVADAVYRIPWYRYSPHSRKAILFIMARSQRPAYLTAGKFAIFSLATFSSIVSYAISFFTVLRSFYAAS